MSRVEDFHRRISAAKILREDRKILAKPDGEAAVSFESNPTGETPWKLDTHSDTIIRLRDRDGATLAVLWANRAESVLQIEYAEVRANARGQGVYRRLLKRLSKQYSVISDEPHNNAAKRAYLALGARERRDGRLVIDRKHPVDVADTRQRPRIRM